MTVGELFDTFGRPVKVLAGRDCSGDLFDKYGRPLIVPVLEPDLTVDHTYSGNSFEGTAGETLALFNLVYLKSDGKYWKADADAASTMPGVAMASGVIAADAVGVFVAPVSYVRDDSWAWTVGGALYASGTAGGLTETAGTVPEIVGYAVTADVIFFFPLLGAGSKAYADATFLKLAGGNMVDDAVLGIGTGAPASVLWETQDANANELLIDLPTGGAVDVPVIVIGQGVTGVDLGLYNGVVNPRIALFGIGAVTTAPVWEFRKARGTIAVPTIITTGDDLGTINFYGYSGSTGYHLSAAIEIDSTGTIGPTGTVRVPSVMRFRTSTDAAPSVLTTWLTIGAAGGLALPNIKIVEDSATVLGIRKVTDSTLVTLQVSDLAFSTTLVAQADASAIIPWQYDGAYMTLKARDTGVANVEIARLAGAADPYFQILRDDTGVALNAVTDILRIGAGGGTGNEAASFGAGIALMLGNAASEVEKRGYLNHVLVVATNAAEESRTDFGVMAAGSLARVLQLTKTGPIFDQLPAADPTVSGMLYYIAATGVVMRSA